MAKRLSIGSRVRNKLADITNSKTMRAHMEDERSSEAWRSNQDVVDQLVEENMALMKLVMEKNEIIDLSEAELNKLRECIQKLQLQNWQLAQSNSHFLAEINLGRDRIKSLGHELECKEALLKATRLNTVGKAGMNNGNYEWQEEEKPTEQFPLAVKIDTKACSGNRKPSGRARNQSMSPSASYSKYATKRDDENKRHCVRAQSGRFRYQMRHHEENSFEIEEDMKFTATGEDEEERKNNNVNSPSSSSALQRSYIGRPLHRAAEKIQSYKEARHNAKIRRHD
ncbi:Shugoshin-1 [Cucurbita argyrosperma subsp. argyrosperma]